MRSKTMKRLAETYQKEAIPALIKKFSYKNIMASPRLKKIVVNIGIGKLVGGKTGQDREKTIAQVADDVAAITGQKPVLTKARISIASFKLRKGMVSGAKVTLRGRRMEDFLDKIIHVVLPRSRDFRGIDKKCVDSMGNLTIGFKEHIFFPEISPEKVRVPLGLEVTVVTSVKNREEALELFSLLGVPFKKTA